MTPSPLRGVFASTGWLAGVPEDFRRAVLDRALPRRYGPGDNLHSEGDESRGMYGLASGTIRVMLSAVDHGPYCGHLLRPGQWAGDGPTMSGIPRPASLVSSGRASVVFLPRATIAEMVADDPACWRHFVGSVTLNLAIAFGAVADLMLRDHRRRLVAVLLRVAGVRAGAPPEGPVTVELSQSDLATMANVARTTALATLRQLEDAGLLKVGYRRLTILSVAGLRRLLQEG